MMYKLMLIVVVGFGLSGCDALGLGTDNSHHQKSNPLLVPPRVNEKPTKDDSRPKTQAAPGAEITVAS